jgi:hypothetical protein
MKTLIAKTRVRNMTKQPRLLRWLTYGGTYLQANQEVIVDGFYPSACEKTQLKAQAVYDIERGLVEVELITNIPTRQPKESELQTRKAEPGVQAFVKPEVSAHPAVESKLPAQTQVDERWARGGIESMKPPAVTLPGHEETLKQVEPQTLPIFPDGQKLETPVAEATAAPEPVVETVAETVAEEKELVPAGDSAEAAEAPAPAPEPSVETAPATRGRRRSAI